MSLIPINRWPDQVNTDPWFDDWWMKSPSPRFDRPFPKSFEDIEREIERHRREMEQHFERTRQELLSRANFPPLPAIPKIPFDNQYAPRLDSGGRGVTIEISLPDHIDPSKVNVSLKDREIIIKAEDKKTRADGESSFQFYQRSTLPPGTDLNQLKATLNNNRLSVHAPINNGGDNRSSFRQVPVDGYGPRAINY